MEKDYNILRTIALLLKVLAVIGFIGSFVTTIGSIFTGGMPPVMDQNRIIILFNNLFPVYFGILQTVILYGLGELLLVFIDIKVDLSKINRKINQ
ncbi:hypothetical protein U472_10540 [Orenia metallireducens]|jgi:hypothetical protein|uniref:Uncharacterized protein n=1 Tax=Orenia metallireducens TaxID=1413210 RepID=A0A1C0A889_9FIRM|nr:hypothetical protein [Orenia metallireducens]OCL26431.1 hypothetical protein U472_10540 [Orenia metallireducens]